MPTSGVPVGRFRREAHAVVNLHEDIRRQMPLQFADERHLVLRALDPRI